LSKVLFHTSPALWPMVEIELDIIQKELDKGNKVALIYCDGVQLACDANNPGIKQSKSKRICMECISRRERAIDWLEPKQGELIPIKYSTISLEKDFQFLKTINHFKNNEIIKKHMDSKIPGVFDAAIASLMTNLRSSAPDIWKYKKKFYAYLKDAIFSYFLADSLIDRIKPKTVYIFNGRMAIYKPWVNLAKFLKIDFFVYEYPVIGYENYLLHKNFTDQDLSVRSFAYYDFYLDSKVSDLKKQIIGDFWFKNRIKRKRQGFENVYSKFQSLNKLPVDWDPKVFNLSFFVSSQDEINVLVNYSNNVASNQIDLIKGIRNTFPNIHINVRIHPNLKGVDPDFVNELIALGEKGHVIIIKPEDDVDSYELIRRSNLIVSCGSTIGVEAAYLGTPSLLVGSSLFESFKCCIKAENKILFYRVIRKSIQGDFSIFPDKELAKQEALRFAWAFVNYGVKPKYFFRKNSYYEGMMIKNGIQEEIKASSSIIIINRTLDLFSNLRVMTLRITRNPRQYLNISSFTWKKLAHLIFPSIPRR
jgi:hypothetical protein